jgi:3-methyladenine DNA glycosylase AlkD
VDTAHGVGVGLLGDAVRVVRHDLIAEIRRTLEDAGDPERARTQQAYMRSVMPFHGISAPALRGLLRPLLADPAYRIAERSEWEATVRELWDTATHREERYAAIALTGHRAYRQWQDPRTVPLYEHLVRTGAWWDLVDALSADRIGPILHRHPAELTPLMRAWAMDGDLWIRRTAILSQLTLKEDTDTALLRDCIEPNIEDPSFWMRKAIGWALRQYARTDPEWVRKTVAGYGERISGLSRREALKHL